MAPRDDHLEQLARKQRERAVLRQMTPSQRAALFGLPQRPTKSPLQLRLDQQRASKTR
jgi:hypothetical protein